jgi:hypothetical protein
MWHCMYKTRISGYRRDEARSVPVLAVVRIIVHVIGLRLRQLLCTA